MFFSKKSLNPHQAMHGKWVSIIHELLTGHYLQVDAKLRKDPEFHYHQMGQGLTMIGQISNCAHVAEESVMGWLKNPEEKRSLVYTLSFMRKQNQDPWELSQSFVSVKPGGLADDMVMEKIGFWIEPPGEGPMRIFPGSDSSFKGEFLGNGLHDRKFLPYN